MANDQRAEYGTSYFGVRDIDAVRRDLDRFVEQGLNAVLHTFGEEDRRFYAGTLQEIVAASRERGMRVYVNPWGVGNVFGGEALSDFSARYPESRQQLSSGDRVPAACFNAPDFRDRMRDWVRAACDLGPDVVFWDEPHWYDPEFRLSGEPASPWACRCPHCRREYRDQFGGSMPDEIGETIKRFRADTLLDFLDEMTGLVAGRGLANAVCVAPNSTPGETDPDPENLSALDHLDVLSATPFWEFHGVEPEQFVGTWGARITDLAGRHDRESQLWIQGFGLVDSPESRERFRTALQTARSHRPDSLMIWGWDACRVMSSLRCESPAEYWNLFLDEIQ